MYLLIFIWYQSHTASPRKIRRWIILFRVACLHVEVSQLLTLAKTGFHSGEIHRRILRGEAVFGFAPYHLV